MKQKRKLVETILSLSEMMKDIGEQEILKKEKITSLQFNILGVVLEENAKTIQEVKEKLLLSSSSISQTIARMEEKQLLKRVYGNNDDKRYVKLKVSEKGKKLYYKLLENYEKLIDEKLSFLQQEDVKLLLKQLVNMKNNLNSKK